MMYQYIHRHFSESEFDAQSSNLAKDGWRLIAVCINPLITVEASPLYVTFWEREVK